MQLKEIINRPRDSPFDEEEMIYVVEFYIKERKNKDVNIVLLYPQYGRGMASQMIMQKEIIQLIHAFEIACEWLKKQI